MSDPTPPETGEPAEQPEPCTGPPSRDEVRQTMRPRFRRLGLPMLEFWATCWFWHWRNTMAFRWLCEAVIVVAVFAGVAGLYWDIEARQEERQEWAKGRAVDHAQLLAQIAALAKDVQFKDPANPTNAERAIAEKAGTGIGPIMSLLAREKVSMRQLNVAGVRFPRYLNLNYANLLGADLSHADLGGTFLAFANLRFAKLIGANLQEADLSYADLRGADLRFADMGDPELGVGYADLFYADLSDADLSGVRKFTQQLLDRACIRERYNYKPPNLDGAEDPVTGKPLVWQGKDCPELTLDDLFP